VRHRIQDTPLQILCEGGDDATFFENLAKSRSLTTYHATCPQGIDGRCIGKGGFAEHLTLIRQGVPSGVPLSGVLIVADSDDDPIASFRDVQRSIRQSDLRVPDNPLQVMTNHSGTPAVAVMMVPWHDRVGNLEMVILDALKPLYPHLVPCLESFRDCARAEDRTPSLQAKMLLRCLISILNPIDPSLALTWFLKRPIEICALDYNCDALSPYAHFLTQFSRQLLP